MTDEPKSDDGSRLFGVSPGGWAIILTAFATSFVMPCLNGYWEYRLRLEQERHGKQLEQVKVAVEENSKKHEELAETVRGVSAMATMATMAVNPGDMPADSNSFNADGPLEPTSPAPE